MDPIEKGSRDYLYIPVRARSRNKQVSTITAQVAFNPPGISPVVGDWRPAEYDYPYVRHLLDGTLPVGTYTVRVRIVDAPTVPILRAGTIDVVEAL